MESLTRLVSESLARHGFDRPLDYRRLHWSRWFRCESHRSLLSVPSKPGVFAVAEEIMNVGSNASHVGTASQAVQARSEASAEGHGNVAPAARSPKAAGPNLAATEPQRMLAVAKFFEDDDMAFTLDRMLSWQNPMRARLESGRYFIRYVVIEDQAQRRSICSALNQWIASSAEIATGIGTHFASSLELAPSETPAARPPVSPLSTCAAQEKDSRHLTDIRCPSLFPSGF
jgi:hypothetical protein